MKMMLIVLLECCTGGNTSDRAGSHTPKVLETDMVMWYDGPGSLVMLSLSYILLCLTLDHCLNLRVNRRVVPSESRGRASPAPSIMLPAVLRSSWRFCSVGMIRIYCLGP